MWEAVCWLRVVEREEGREGCISFVKDLFNEVKMGLCVRVFALEGEEWVGRRMERMGQERRMEAT